MCRGRAKPLELLKNNMKSDDNFGYFHWPGFLKNIFRK